jgi:hypothetical protein
LQDTWSISKRREACSYCGEEFRERGIFYSVLSEDEDEGLVREDFCPSCWEKFRTQPHFCFWRCCREERAEKQVLDTEVMLSLFEQLEGALEERKRAFRFVLALYLMRRKELRLDKIARDGDAELMVFKRKGSGERVEVINPDLDEARIQQVSEHLTELLNASL